jgi:pimeloyl-ACP methyl ester carboxylesterase
VRVFHRQAGPVDAPTLLLLHGFPSSSQQFRRLIDALGERYRLIAPDYPGFGYTEVPAGFSYTFERIADVIEGFVDALGLTRFALYLFDLGGPVGLRLAGRRPQSITGLVVQNANLYQEGLSGLARAMIDADPTTEQGSARVGQMFEPAVTRRQYEGGTTATERVSPDGWTLDQHFLDLPGRRQVQRILHADHPANVALYPVWQRWLREHQPPTLIVWGRHDAFFTEAGAHAYLTDLPDAELHLFETGHFALEESLTQIAPLIEQFLDRLTEDS